MTKPTLAQITTRTRSLGFGWTSQTVQRGEYLAIAAPAVERTGMTPRQVLQAAEDARRSASGCDYRMMVTLGGREIRDPREALTDLRRVVEYGATVTVEFAEAVAS